MPGIASLIRNLALSVAIACCVLACERPCEGKKRPVPAATLDLNQFFKPDPTKHALRTGARFLTDSKVAVSACKNGDCALVLVNWDGVTLHPYAQTHQVSGHLSLVLTEGGSLLVLADGTHHSSLYSPDLSTKSEAGELQKASPTGNTVAEYNWHEHKWNLYHLKTSAHPKLELIRQATEELKALTDEVAVFLAEDDTVRIETLQGEVLSSFKYRMWCNAEIGIEGADGLSIHACRSYRLVDFTGKELLKVRVPRGNYTSADWSADRKRVLLDVLHRTHTTGSGWLGLLDAAGSLWADQAPTDERVRVVDPVSGKACFDLRRSFPEGSESGMQNATLSPSGKFVALVDKGTLAVYPMPAGCERR